MNWFSKRQKSDKCLQDVSSARRLSKPQAATLLVCLAGVGIFLYGDASQLKPKTLASISPQSLAAKVDVVATSITVKVLSSNFLGSGFIVQEQDNTYTVITNRHVLRAGEPPYKIQTPDGKIYQAEVIEELNSTDYDLALLRFESSEEKYPTATIGSSSYLEIGEPIFAAGFPYRDRVKVNATSTKEIETTLPGFVLKQGRIAIFLDKALEEGYQIGYTNDVKKGMSGGPLLNSRGEVVGVNGKHAYPLWEAPDFYQDGSQPCAPLQELITRSSLAIPIEKGIGLTSKLKSLKKNISIISNMDTDLSSISVDSDDSDNPDELVAKMRAEAEAIRKCNKLP
ncbi:MAG: hypothetical protein Tsb0014_33590 [Pleurocapsa sp.]